MEQNIVTFIPHVVRNCFQLLIVLLIGGALLITFGGIIAYNESRGVDRFTSVPVAYFSIAVGIIVSVFSFVGTYFLFRKQNKSQMIIVFMLMISVFCILQSLLAGFSLATIENDNYKLTRRAKKAVADLFKQYGNSKDVTETIDSFQRDFACCGITNASDWYITIGSGVIEYLPQSCCNDAIIYTTCTIYLAHTESCAEAYQNLITIFVKVVAGVSLGFAGIELIGIIMSFVYLCRNKNR